MNIRNIWKRIRVETCKVAVSGWFQTSIEPIEGFCGDPSKGNAQAARCTGGYHGKIKGLGFASMHSVKGVLRVKCPSCQGSSALPKPKYKMGVLIFLAVVAHCHACAFQKHLLDKGVRAVAALRYNRRYGC